MTFEQLELVTAAYAERLYHEVQLPGLRASFPNVSDDDCKEIIAEAKSGVEKAPTIRQKAFQVLAEGLMPFHLRPDDAVAVKREPVKPLPGISKSAARGIVQAVSEGLVRPHTLWIKLASDYPAIEAAAAG